MTTLEDLLFPVKKVAVKETFGIPANSDYSHAIIGTIDGTEKILNVCSDRYELIPNSDVFSVIEALLNNYGVNFTKSYKMINHAKFYAKYIILDVNGKSLDVNVGTKDNPDMIKPVIQIDHSYNGLNKYSFTFGYFRMICTNGLIIPAKGQEEKNLNIVGKHTVKIKESIDQLHEKIEYFITVNGLLTQRFKTLVERPLKNWVDRLESVLEAQKIKTTGNQLDVIKDTIKKEKAELNQKNVNDWLVYNGVNAHIYKGVNSKGETSKAAPEVKRKKDKDVFKFMLENAPN